MDAFVRRVKVRAAEKRLDSDKAIARAAGVNDFVIHNLSKAGRKSFPYADNAVRIARALETTVEYLVTGENVSGPELPPDVQDFLRALSRLDDDLRPVYLGRIRGYTDSILEEAERRKEERARLAFPDRRRALGT